MYKCKSDRAGGRQSQALCSSDSPLFRRPAAKPARTAAGPHKLSLPPTADLRKYIMRRIVSEIPMVHGSRPRGSTTSRNAPPPRTAGSRAARRRRPYRRQRLDRRPRLDAVAFERPRPVDEVGQDGDAGAGRDQAADRLDRAGAEGDSGAARGRARSLGRFLDLVDGEHDLAFGATSARLTAARGEGMAERQPQALATTPR